MTAQVSTRKVAHEGPRDAPIFFIGECPGTSEDAAQRPLVGKSGDLFDAALLEVGLSRDAVRIGNLLNYQPVKNDFDRAKGSWQMEESRKELQAYLRSGHGHKLLVPLGVHAMEFLLGYKEIEKRRGSVYEGDGVLVMPCLHPSAVLRDGSNTVAFLHDLAKARRIAEQGWTEPTHNFIIDPDSLQIAALLPTLLAAPRLWVDIETRRGTGELKCIGFAWSPTDAVCIFADSPAWHVVRDLLESPIPKTFHNGYFDTMLLRHWGYEVAAWDYDTMVMQHCLQPELPLGLDYCASIYTNLNYWKDDGKDSTDRVPRQRLGRYNCLDVVGTCGVELAQRLEVDPIVQRLFDYEFSQVPLAQHFAQTGLYVDEARRAELDAIVSSRRDKALTLFVGLCSLYGTEPFLVTQHQKVKDFLYKTLELPTRTNKDGKVTADEDAIVSLLTTCQRELQTRKTETGQEPWKHKIAALRLILQIRGSDKLLSSYLHVTRSADGRVRSNYNITGTETGRWSSSSFWDDTGLNGQTIPREEV